jgi:hypothetical protein
VSSTQKPDRLRTLLETGVAISSELSLDGVLQRIVEAAARVTEARYAALGVIDRTGTGLERFVTTGMDDDTRAAIGDLPRGRGILGVLISDGRWRTRCGSSRSLTARRRSRQSAISRSEPRRPAPHG